MAECISSLVRRRRRPLSGDRCKRPRGVILAIRVKVELRVMTPSRKKGKRGALSFFFPSRSIKGIKHHPPLRLPSSTATRSSTHVQPPSSRRHLLLWSELVADRRVGNGDRGRLEKRKVSSRGCLGLFQLRDVYGAFMN
ncbi:hypothetical protein LXL04_002300 [Taraxacum kok-saghyz]